MLATLSSKTYVSNRGNRTKYLNTLPVYNGLLAPASGRQPPLNSCTKGLATRRPPSLTSGRYVEAEIERPISRQMVAGPRNHER